MFFFVFFVGGDLGKTKRKQKHFETKKRNMLEHVRSCWNKMEKQKHIVWSVLEHFWKFIKFCKKKKKKKLTRKHNVVFRKHVGTKWTILDFFGIF